MSTLHRILVALVIPSAVFLAGCARDAPQDTLQPEGPIARQINTLWWPVFWIAVAIFFAVEGLLVFAVYRFRERRDSPDPPQVHGNLRLEVAWTIAPAILLTGVAVVTVAGIFDLARTPTEEALEVTVTARQWWWEYEYPALGVVTANELHIPTDQPVFLTLRSYDVIHSFWVPKLAGKQDVLPNRENHLTIRAERPGVYKGQCAEYCGLSHANMRLLVIAQDRTAFEGWVADQLREAESPQAALAAQGERLFQEPQLCAACHSVRGTDARGTLGPDLTHFASRTTFAGALFENNPENLARWIRDPPAMKPMTPYRTKNPIGMPSYRLTEEQIAALVAYLQTLR